MQELTYIKAQFACASLRSHQFISLFAAPKLGDGLQNKLHRLLALTSMLLLSWDSCAFWLTETEQNTVPGDFQLMVRMS